MNLPDKKARRAILDIHVRGLPLDTTIDLDQVAAGTPGLSGADLENLLNETAISAARKGNASISLADTEEARDKIMMGTVRTLAIQPDEKRRLAVHETGHTAVAFHTADADPVYKFTVIPRGRALGGTHALPENERHVPPENYLRAQLSVLLAGRAAAKHFLGTVSSGAEDNIHRATDLARHHGTCGCRACHAWPTLKICPDKAPTPHFAFVLKIREHDHVAVVDAEICTV